MTSGSEATSNEKLNRMSYSTLKRNPGPNTRSRRSSTYSVDAEMLIETEKEQKIITMIDPIEDISAKKIITFFRLM